MIEERMTVPSSMAADSGHGRDSVASTFEPSGQRSMSAAREELAIIGAQLNNGHTRLIALMRHVLAEELWCGVGFRSPEQWLTAYAGLTWSSAHDVVRIAERCAELPTMQRLLEDGRLTLGLAAVIAKHTPAAYDADVAEFASYTTVTQLRRALCRYQFNADATTADEDSGDEDSNDEDSNDDSSAEPAAEEATEQDDSSAFLPGDAADDADRVEEATDAAQSAAPGAFDPTAAPPRLQMRYAGGRFQLTYDAPADIGALVEQALLEAKDSLFHLHTRSMSEPRPTGAAACGEGSADASRTHGGVSFGEAMSLMAQRSLDDGAPLGHSRASRYRVYLHLDTKGNGWLHKQSALPPNLRDRVLCDGVIQPVWETEGKPVNVGRAQRIVPARTRRLLEDRDRGCRFPGCLTLHHLECHHLDHWINGGRTDAERMIMLCPFHHDEHHRGTFVMVGDPTRPDGVTFTARDGTRIGPDYRTYPPPGRSSTARSSTDTSKSDPHHPARWAPYAGPTNDKLHLSLVRFDPRPPPSTPDG
ncbi:HNH endonuclease signature motif containing protein [Flexivirga sp. B27]